MEQSHVELVPVGVCRFVELRWIATETPNRDEEWREVSLARTEREVVQIDQPRTTADEHHVAEVRVPVDEDLRRIATPTEELKDTVQLLPKELDGTTESLVAPRGLEAPEDLRGGVPLDDFRGRWNAMETSEKAAEGRAIESLRLVTQRPECGDAVVADRDD